MLDDFSSFMLNSFPKKWNVRLLPKLAGVREGPGPFATRRLYEPEVDELFLTHLLVLPSTGIFLSGRFSTRNLVQRQAGGPQP